MPDPDLPLRTVHLFGCDLPTPDLVQTYETRLTCTDWLTIWHFDSDLTVPDTTPRTSEDECKWYCHQMIYFPETIIQWVQCYNWYLHLSLAMYVDTYSVHGRSLKSWCGRLPCFQPSCHVFPSPLSGLNWCSLAPIGGPGPPTPRVASLPTGSTHTPLSGYRTLTSPECLYSWLKLRTSYFWWD
jgi:hypothetical protein